MIVMGLVASALIGTMRSAPQTALRAEEEAEIMRVSSVLRRQLITISTSNATTDPVVGETGQTPRTDNLSIVTSSLLHSGGVGMVDWRIRQDAEAPPYLAYREIPYVGGETTGEDRWTPFSTLVRGMEVRYWSEPDWVEIWKRPLIPERIKVTCWYPTPDGESTFTIEAAPGIALRPRGAQQPGAEPTSRADESPSPSPAASAAPTALPSPKGLFTP